jgi:hypothetical protein
MYDRRLFLGLALTAAALLCAGAPALAEVVKPAQQWTDVIRDETLKKEAPKDGLLTDAKAFAKLWKAWRPKEKVPDIDFKKQFVLVRTAGGPNRPFMNAKVDEKGNLTASVGATLIGGEGFGYLIAVFDRKGVKTVDGKPLK